MVFKPQEGRVQTGIMQFGDDFPGVFIRGDHAAYYTLVITDLLAKLNNGKSLAAFDPIALTLHANNLINILGCSHGEAPTVIQVLKPLTECVA